MSAPAAAPVEAPDLRSLRVLVLTSGHEALDGRVYAREALSLHGMGASVTVVGQRTRGTAGAVPIVEIRPVSSRLARFLLQPWRCLWAARNIRPDVVHFHDAEMLSALPVARLLWPRARFVYDVHEDFGNLMMIRDWLPRPLKPGVRLLTEAFEKGLARLAHGIVAVTPPLADRFPHRRRVVAYNYVTPDFFAQAGHSARAPAERQYDLVHLGTLNRRRAGFLAQVLREFHAMRPGARSLLLGAEETALTEVAGDLPPGCEVMGKVPYERVAALLGDARVGLDVHPWLAPHLIPALAVKVCEYMACGCGVVASAMPVLDAIVAGAGLAPESLIRIDGGAPGEYARAVVRILEAIDGGADPGASLRVFADERMNWRGEALKIGRFYRELTGNGSCAV